MIGKKRSVTDTACELLPERLPCARRLMRLETALFSGLLSMGGKGEGALAEGQNLSGRWYPSLATRKPRRGFCYVPGGGTPHGMIYFGDALYVAYGTGLYRATDGEVRLIATVTDTDKQFFVFGNRLYMYPDKLYMEKGSAMPRSIEIDTGVLNQLEFQRNAITLPQGMTWKALGFEAGDCLQILIGDDANLVPEGYYHIKAVQGRVATVEFTFSTLYTGAARCLRVVPTLERYCVSGNRVYGILGENVYVSREGSAMDWYSRDADGTGPAILHTGTEEPFTACIPWQGYVAFFKPHGVYKLLGTRADTFSLQESGGAGLPLRLRETLCEVNGELYYHGENGVYRYRGQDSELVCGTGETEVTGGCGGSDGRAYFLTLRRADSVRTYVYAPDLGIWYVEDGMSAFFMAQRQGFLWAQAGDGYVWMCASDGRVGSGRIDERMAYGEVASSVTLRTDHAPSPEGFRLVAVYIRATASAGGEMSVWASYGDGHTNRDAQPGAGILLGEFTGAMTDRLLRIPVFAPASDSVSLTLRMKGEWVLHSVVREYERPNS